MEGPSWITLVLLLPLLAITQAQNAAPKPFRRTCSLGRLDLVIILDASTSVTQANFDKMIEFTKSLLSTADIDSGAVRVGILTYSTDVSINFHLNQYTRKADVMAAFKNIRYLYGSTNSADALRRMRTEMFTVPYGDRPDVPNAGIIITDGLSNINSRRTIPEARAVHDAKIRMYSIGIGLSDDRELIGMATSQADSFSVTDFDELTGLDEKLFSSLCSDLVDKVVAPARPVEPEVYPLELNNAVPKDVVPAPRGCGLSQVDLVIIIDASTSVTEANYKKMLAFCKDLVDFADVDSGSVRIGVLIYSTDVEAIFQLNTYQSSSDIKNAIDQIPYIYGSTNTADALQEMHSRFFTVANGDRPDVDNVAIVLTDGVSNINARRTIPEAKAAHGKNIHVYAIGIGLIDTREVDAIASSPASDNSFNVQDFNELSGLADEIFGSGLGDRCPTVTTTVAPPTCGLSKVDVVIILDASTSVTEKNFVKMLGFAKDIVDRADIDSGSVRVGVAMYSTDVEVSFHLNQYNSKASLMKAIDNINYMYGSTNSADALKKMHAVMFTQTHGDRPDAENIAFMITDGVSNINARRTIPEAQDAHGKGILVYAIGIGLSDTRELDAMATPPASEHSFNVQEFDELAGLVDTIFEAKAEECADNPPVANAGEDLFIQLPIDFAKLVGDKSTDDKGIVKYTWSMISGAYVNYDGIDTPYFSVFGLQAGEYYFMLTVEDEQGQTDTDEVKITVEGADEPPTADAGEDATIQLPMDTYTFSGKGSYDDVAVVEYSWKLKSGDFNFFMDGETSPELTLYGLTAGTYTFTLSVTDGQGQSDSDDVTLVVEGRDFPPTADAGADVETDPRKFITLNGQRSFDDNAIVRYQWRLVSGDQNSVRTENTDAANLGAVFLQPGTYTYALTVYDAQGQSDEDTVTVTVKGKDLPPKADAGQDVETDPRKFVTLSGRGSSDDKGIVTYQWTLVSGRQDVVKTENTDAVDLGVVFLEPGSYTFALSVYDGLRQTDQDTVTVVVKGPDHPPTANAGLDIQAAPGEQLVLSGASSSDDNAIVHYQWALVSGDAAAVRTGNDGSVDLEVEFLRSGTYTFALTVFDELGQTDEDTVEVIIEAPNAPPRADAGSDVTVQLPVDSVTLDGRGSSDDQFVAHYFWSMAGDNPDRVTLVDPTSPTLEVRDLKPGTYTFGLLVADEQGATDTDFVDVIVEPAPNQPPVAYAGEDLIIQLPTDFVTLDGTGSTDDVGIVRYRWRLKAGDDATLNMKGEKRDTLRVTGMLPGDYSFSLTVVDKDGLKNTDFVKVSVLDNYPPNANAGDDVTVTYPDDSVTLYGDQSDDDIGIVTWAWVQTDGVPSAVMVNPDEPNLQVAGLRPGRYEYTLTVTDNMGQTSSDAVVIIVEEPQTTVPTCGLDKVDLVFVIDASTSVTEANFKKQLDFVNSIVQFADIDSGSVRVGALIYSTDVQQEFYLNDYNTKQDVMDAVSKIPYIYGSTNTADALQSMREKYFSYRNGDRDDAPNVAIVITDGVSNINARRTIPEAVSSHDIGIHVIAVGIGLTDTRELDAIATPPHEENSYAVNDFDELSGLESKIFSSTGCPDTTTTPTTTTTVTTTTTPLPTTTPSCGLAKTDLIFILDASTSVTEANFQKMRDFVKDFVRNSDINSGSVRVGLNIYSTDVEIMFHLNQYNNLQDLLNAIDEVPYIYGSTNSADALQTMRDVMFTSTNGDRPDAPNVGIIVTDGISNINSRRTIPEAQKTHGSNIHVYAIGIGLTDRRELDAMASPPATSNSFVVNSFDELVGLEQTIFASECPGTTTTTEAPFDEPPVANAGDDVELILPDNTIVLSGELSTDDIGIVSYTWTMLDGPAEVNVVDTDGQFLKLDNLVEGVYEIELEVVDALGQKDTDVVMVTVLPEPNEPPVADAGPDKTIQLPDDSVTIFGDKSYDDKAVVLWDWQVDFDGQPGGQAKPNNDRLELYNLNEGIVTVTLTVFDDNGESSTDTAVITVLPEPDLPPTANAGPDRRIQLPDDTTRLDGSGSTDDKRVVSYNWRLTSGDGRGVRTSGADTPYLSVNGLPAGEYEYTLTVADKKGQTDTDSAMIFVEPARTTGWDVIFVLDSSVSPQHFRWMVDYSRMLIREMSIDDGEFRVGYLIYSNGAYRQFNLNAYDTKDDVLAAVDKVGYRPGDKNTASALKYVRKQMFRSSKGDRDYAPNYVIHLTGDALSMDPFDAATEACQLQSEGVGMFATGFGNVRDRTELHASSSLPTEDYESVVRNDRDFGEKPGLMIYTLKNGVPQPTPCPVTTTLAPTTTTRRTGPIKCTATGDVIFILDSSGSVGQENFYRVLNFTYQTIDGLDVDSGQFRIGVTTFSDTSRLDFHLNEFNNLADMKSALQSRVVYMYGNTHTAHALRRVRTEMFTAATGDRPDVPNIVVIITDGQSNVNHEMTVPEARALKAAGVTILTVAVGFTSETSELVGLTSPPISDNLIYVEDYESLSKLKEQLVEPLCTDSNLCRKKPCMNGGVCMDGIRTFVCMCPENYFGETCNKQCGEPADVVIVLDSSNSVGEYNFGRLKEYAEHLVRAMNKDSCNINLGFLKYSSDAMVQVYLGMHGDTETNVRAIDQISYSRGRANMAAAFRALRTRMFNGHGGDRPGARNIAYFLSDGTNDVNAEMTETEADLTISSGVRVIPIGVNLRSRYELDNIAGVQGIDLIEIDDEAALMENTDDILRPMYEGNNMCDEEPCLNGGTCFNEPFGFRCQCVSGFSGDTCSKRCAAKGDVVFAIDTSRYVTRGEMKKVRKFLRSVIKRMNFRRDGFSVGMVTFSDWAKVTMEFNQGTSKRSVRSAIAGLRVHGGDPEPAQALAKANYRIFNGNGNSKERPDYLILVTKSMRNELDILDEANKLKVQGVRIIGVGVDLTASEKDAMQSAVSMPIADTAMFADDAHDLGDIGEKIVEYMCDDEDVCAENPCQNGGSCVKRGGDFYCDCGVGYAGRYCENRCNARADVVLLLDSSGSVGHVDFRQVKTFAHNLVGDLAIGKDQTRVGLASFSSNSRHGFYMNAYYDMFLLQNAIAGIGYEYGNTNTAAGLRLVRERYFSQQNGDRPNIQNFVIIITDGVSNIQPEQTLVEAQKLKEQGVHIYAVGLGDFDTTEIYGIASAPSKDNAFILKDYNALGDISSNIVKKTCRDPSACDENPCRNGGICVPGINGAFCECPAGYRGEHCKESCVQTKDIFFVLDSSDSVGLQNWATMLSFVNRIIGEFSGKGTFNRFSLITYSTNVQVVFSLGRYNTYSVIKNAVKYARYRPGRTNTASALRTVHEFSEPILGDRSDAENLVFLLTDGLSNVNEDDTLTAATVLKSSGARVIPIAINMENYSEVEQIATNEGEVFKVENFNSLDGIVEDLYKAICENGNVIEAGKK